MERLDKSIFKPGTEPRQPMGLRSADGICQKNYPRMQGRLDRIILNALAGDTVNIQLINNLGRMRLLPHSRVLSSLNSKEQLNIDTLSILRALVSPGEKRGKSYRHFPEPSLLHTLQIDHFLTRLTPEGVRRTLVWTQSIIEGTLLSQEDGRKEGIWQQATKLVSLSSAANQDTAQGITRYLEGDVDLSIDDWRMLLYNRGRRVLKPHPVFSDNLKRLTT